MSEFDLDQHIRKVPDFPKPGILFYDVTSVLMSPEAFGWCIDELAAPFTSGGIEAIAAIDARGFLFGAPVARILGLPLILVRKQGKLPGDSFRRTFDLEYGTDTIEIHRADLSEPRRVLLLDDLIATGGTLAAAASILEEAGSTVVEIGAVIGLPFLNYDRLLGGYRVRTLIQYHGE
ncbi:MAG: adenine phosphoribosyltransferase [Spirochaetaceae bacterium]|nr:MAG: adenine phosphoribosyltransferase [Spirochaetaceae bacterium]